MNELNDSAKHIYQNINLIERYNKLAIKFNDWDNRIIKVDKNRILQILKNYHYPFKYLDKDFYFTEKVHDFVFHIALQVKGGVGNVVINVKKDNEFYDFQSGNIGRVNKLILGLETGSLILYSNYDQLSEIIESFLLIYEDFKAEFLKQVEQEN